MEYILVTGATSGIGKAYAQLLAKSGYNLLLTGRRETELAAVAKAVAEAGHVLVEQFIGDLTTPAVLAELLERCSKLAISGIVNNAGFGTSDPFLQDGFDRQWSMMDLHCRVSMKLSHELLPKLLGTNPFIINVASMAADMPFPGAALYSASKAALVRFSECLDLELAASPVIIQCLMPGFTHTDFHGRLDHFAVPQKSQGIIRWMRPEQVVSISWRKLKKGRVRCLPGFANQFLHGFVTRLPWRWYRFIAARQIM